MLREALQRWATGRSPPLIELPQGLSQRVLEVHGSVGQCWLDEVPALIRELEEIWGIQVESTFPDCSYNYVASVLRRDGSEAVLKLSVPGKHLVAEAKSLEAYGGKGAPALLEQDLGRGAILMERIRPGTDIADLPFSQAVSAAVEVMGQLHQAPIPQGALPTVTQWGQGFDRLRGQFNGGSGPLPSELVREGEQVFNDLAASMGPAVLLHGDLHHMNILAGGERSWIAIDPQGVVGERAYEVGAFLRNPMPAILEWPDLDRLQRERISQFSTRLGISPQRIAGWGFSQAVLSAIWALEDHGRGWSRAVAIALSLRESAFA